jgi:hypothetical protein
MADKIKLVQGDNLPYIKLSLKNPNETALDVSDCVVRVYFRAKGQPTILSTFICTKPNGGADGVVVFNPTLNVEPGYYEGEVEIEFGGLKQTVYETLQFQVRAQFS